MKATERDWNSEYQALLDLLNDDTILDHEILWTNLYKLAEDFSYTAQTISRMLVSERYLNNKLLLPFEVGGFASGVKFKHHNILFKFATDPYKIHGGDSNAIKASAQELLAISSFFEFHSLGLCTPLSCIIDICGNRIVAQSILPIDGNKTLLYGSSNGGLVFKDSDPIFREKIDSAMRQLNLREHTIEEQSTKRKLSINTPFDVEGHLGIDGRYYVLDLARLFPSVPPTYLGSDFHCMFRPEFLHKNRPLSCDAYRSLEVNSAITCAEIHDAEAFLLNSCIPEFGKWLNDICSNSIVDFDVDLLGGINVPISNSNKINYDLGNPIFPLTPFLHRAGINLRYLGRVRQQLDSFNQWKKFILCECIARTLKHQLRAKLRCAVISSHNLGLYPYLDAAVSFLNDVFGSSENSIEYWNTILEEELIIRFPEVLKSEKLISIRTPEFLAPLLLRLCTLAGLVLSPDLVEQLENFDIAFSLFEHEIPIDNTQLVDITTRVKFSNIQSYAKGTSLFIRALALREQHRQSDCLRIAALARTHFRNSLRTNLSDPATLCNLGFLFSSIFNRKDHAINLYQRALIASPLHVRSQYYLGIAYRENKNYSMAEECFLTTVKISNGLHANACKDLANFYLYQKHDIKRAEFYYKQAISIQPNHTAALFYLGKLLITRLTSRSSFIEAVSVLLKAGCSNGYCRNQVLKSSQLYCVKLLFFLSGLGPDFQLLVNDAFSLLLKAHPNCNIFLIGYSKFIHKYHIKDPLISEKDLLIHACESSEMFSSFELMELANHLIFLKSPHENIDDVLSQAIRRAEHEPRDSTALISNLRISATYYWHSRNEIEKAEELFSIADKLDPEASVKLDSSFQPLNHFNSASKMNYYMLLRDYSSFVSSILDDTEKASALLKRAVIIKQTIPKNFKACCLNIFCCCKLLFLRKRISGFCIEDLVSEIKTHIASISSSILETKTVAAPQIESESLPTPSSYSFQGYTQIQATAYESEFD